MGLFSSLKKQNTGVPRSSLAWLEDAEEVYTRAYHTTNLQGCEKYFSRDVYRTISEEIRRNGKTYSGLTRYRHTSWEMKTQGVYLRIITYDQMQISKGIQAKVGEDFTEEWTLGETNEGTKIVKIRRVS